MLQYDPMSAARIKHNILQEGDTCSRLEKKLFLEHAADSDRLGPHLEKCMEDFPCFANAEIQSVVNGPITYTPGIDGFFVKRHNE